MDLESTTYPVISNLHIRSCFFGFPFFFFFGRAEGREIFSTKEEESVIDLLRKKEKKEKGMKEDTNRKLIGRYFLDSEREK